jgi:2-keto-3-deoxy-L-rhamnonate aldolase RhmA
MLNLMYITNKPWVAKIAEEAGVDWIFVDMEWIGKDSRQGGLDTVQNHHTIADIRNIKQSVSKADVLVRVNPMHDALANYPSSKDEINAAIEAGADIIMLPFFKTVNEVKAFIEYVNDRAKTCLLVETPEAAVLLDEIVEIEGIDMIHLGLNDLHLALKMKFMFELLSNGMVDQMAAKIKAKGIPFGFGGIATLTGGAIPGSMILKEHVRLGSSMVIVSRSFCNTDSITDPAEVKRIFDDGITAIRKQEHEAELALHYFSDNTKAVKCAVEKLIN